MFCTFWLRNVLRATTACTFSTAQLLKVLRSCGVLYILTWKCASRHSGMQFFITHLASWLRTRRFSEPTFRPSGATNHWKNTVFCDWIFFLLTLSLLWSSLFYSSLLSDSSRLCFSSVHIVGSLTSKTSFDNIIYLCRLIPFKGWCGIAYPICVEAANGANYLGSKRIIVQATNQKALQLDMLW